MEKILGIVYAYDVKGRLSGDSGSGIFLDPDGVSVFPGRTGCSERSGEAYLKDREQMIRAHEAGIQIMPSTPGMGGYYYSETDGETRYRDAWPDFVGGKGKLRNTTGMWRIPALLSAGT